MFDINILELAPEIKVDLINVAIKHDNIVQKKMENKIKNIQDKKPIQRPLPLAILIAYLMKSLEIYFLKYNVFFS